MSVGTRMMGSSAPKVRSALKTASMLIWMAAAILAPVLPSALLTPAALAVENGTANHEHPPDHYIEMGMGGGREVSGSISLVLTGLVLGLTFYGARDLYAGLKAAVQRLMKWLQLFQWPTRSRWKAPGQWVDPTHHASLVAYSRRRRWPLTIDKDGYVLLIGAMDPEKGTAAGKLKCTAVKRPVGSFALQPAHSPNQLALSLEFANQQVNLTLRRTS